MAWPEVAKTTRNVCRGHSVRGFSLHAESNNRAASNLFVSRAVKTQFADSQPAVRSYGRTERAARHWPGIVKVAQPRFRIEHRTGLVVRKFLEALFRLRTFVEHSRFSVAGKLRRQPLNRISRPRSNTARLLRVRLFEVREPLLQSDRIQLINGKHTHAALRASRTTRQPLAATPRGLGQSSIHDLDQRAIRSRQSP